MRLKNNIKNYDLFMLDINFISKTTQSRFDLILEHAAKKINDQILINYVQAI